MTLIQRRLLYLSFFALFFVLAPILIAYSSGYRFSFRKNQIYETGSLSVESIPSSADVWLDGQNLQQTTPLILNNLKERFYAIEVKKQGFTTWRKNIFVSAKLTSFVGGVRLFPTPITPIEFTPAKTILARRDLFQPNGLSPNRNETLVIQGLELWVAPTVAVTTPSNLFLTRFSRPIRKAIYLDGNNILALVDNIFLNIERDSRDTRVITEVYVSPKDIIDFGYENGKVYFTTQEQSATKVYYFDIEK